MAGTTTTATPPAETTPIGDAAESAVAVESAEAGLVEATPYAAKTGDMVTDGTGRIGLVLAPDKDRGGAPIPAGEAAEPMVLWLQGVAAPYGAELAPVE